MKLTDAIALCIALQIILYAVSCAVAVAGDSASATPILHHSETP